MKKQIKFLAVGVCAFVLGVCVNNAAFSDIANLNVAVVDVQTVVSNSTQFKSLKAEQQAKVASLKLKIQDARKNIAAEKDATKKKAIEDKANKDLKAKIEANDKEYAKKLQALDSSISSAIATQAKAKNFDLVLAKGVVLYGGTDITKDVVKAVK